MAVKHIWSGESQCMTALRARIDGHTRIEVGFVARLTVMHPRGG
jgi:hypothetical protein